MRSLRLPPLPICRLYRFARSLVTRSDARDDVLTHALLLFATHTVNLLGNLVVDVWLAHTPSAFPLSLFSHTAPTHTFTVRSRLDEDHRRLAVSALQGQVERGVACPVGGVEAGLGAALGRAQENVEKRAVARRRGAVEGVLVCAVAGVNLESKKRKASGAVAQAWRRAATEESLLTSAPRVMRRRPIWDTC